MEGFGTFRASQPAVIERRIEDHRLEPQVQGSVGFFVLYSAPRAWTTRSWKNISRVATATPREGLLRLHCLSRRDPGDRRPSRTKRGTKIEPDIDQKATQEYGTSNEQPDNTITRQDREHQGTPPMQQDRGEDVIPRRGSHISYSLPATTRLYQPGLDSPNRSPNLSHMALSRGALRLSGGYLCRSICQPHNHHTNHLAAFWVNKSIIRGDQ